MFYRILVAVMLMAGGAGVFNELVAGQSLLNSDTETYTLRGTVVNSVTGEAVPGALVELSGHAELAVRADGAGRFEFTKLAAGTLQVRARKPGYFGAEDNPDVAPPTVVRVGADGRAGLGGGGTFAAPAGAVETGVAGTGGTEAGGANSFAAGSGGAEASGDERVVVKLVPEGIIYGRISGEDDEPIEGMPVQLNIQRVEDGRKRIMRGLDTQTDESGRFRVAKLLPGKYILLVGPENLREFSSGSASSTVSEYGAVYHPGASELASATVIEITAGRHFEADLKMGRQPMRHVSGVVVGAPSPGAIELAAFSATGLGVGNYNVDPNTGAFDAVDVPASAVKMWALAIDPKGHMRSGSTPLTDAVNQSGARIALVPAVDLAGTLKLEDSSGQEAGGDSSVAGQRNSPLAYLSLEQLEGFPEGVHQFGPTGTADSSALVAKGLFPGTYRLRVQTQGRYYVKSAKSGEVNLLGEDLQVAPGATPTPLEIVLGNDPASLAVSPQRDGATVRATVVLLSDAGPNASQVRRPSGSSNEVYFINLAPGHYRVIALPPGSDPEYASAEFRSKYLRQAQDLTLEAGQKAKVGVELAKAVE